MSPHRRRKGYQVSFAGIGSFNWPKARYGLVGEDPFFCVFLFIIIFFMVHIQRKVGNFEKRSDHSSHNREV